ncbi:hypothetical protein FBU30_011244 [Linnemannia zychae]|nr:hypothetical protein FBU30_011244 [Linnemannia zychae]
MQPTAQSNFIPDLDMSTPPTWSKPASALGLANPLHHLPQSQQVRQLQEQIQQHRRLQQQQSQSGYGINEHVMRKKQSQNTKDTGNNQDRHFQQSVGGSGGNTHQHINIKNTDEMNSDKDIENDDQDNDDDDENLEDHQSSSSTQDLHLNRSLSHPQLTQGFSIPIGFAGFAPSSPLSPSSPGSIGSESASITASMLSPGLLSPTSGVYSPSSHGNHNTNPGNNNNTVHGIESSLASLASLSVMSSSPSVMPMSMPTTSRNRTAFSSPHHSTPTSSSFQAQSLPVIYQNQQSNFHSSHNNTGRGQGFVPTSASSSVTTQTPSFNAFSSALSQHFQRQQQQQQQIASASAMSSSLPTHSTFNPFQQPQNQHLQQQQQQHEQQQPPPPQQQRQQPQQQQPQNVRSRSKSLTIPAPRIIPPARILPPRAPLTSAPRKYHGRQTRKIPTAPPTPKEVVDPTRRVAHIISEQKRREKINGGFDELKSVIPE